MISQLTEKIRNKPAREITLFMVYFYLVGLAGTIIPFTRPLFLLIFPFAILLSLAVLMLFPENASGRKVWIMTAVIAVSGFVVEVAGVATGKIFGSYSYGQTLGPKLFETPLMIGVNWALLVLATASITERLKINVLFRISTAAAMMMVYDIFLEITADKLDMWYWKGEGVPVRNYVAWFVIAFIMHALLKLAGIRITFRSDIPVISSQVAYFILLSVWFTFAS
ncbi:MAG: carotenoid biosynthesis protein [Bacteroidales bacterium]|nr:carotenoid biosynthesis protein [Bacteroidales bacterium]